MNATKPGLSASRRSFLKKGLAAGVGAAAIYVAPSMSSAIAHRAYAGITGPPVPGLPLEIDEFPNAIAFLTLSHETLGPIIYSLTGPLTIHASIGLDGETLLTDGAGHDMVETEIVSMNLTGSGGYGALSLGVRTSPDSTGKITEATNNTPGTLDLDPFKPGTADSFFDVFFEVQLGGAILVPNPAQIRIPSTVNVKPAGNESFTNVAGSRPLFDSAGVSTFWSMNLTSLVFCPACP
ncbi:MAG: twin-arginine translocation signal domain-containing protein [Chloroflexi bacterium]|nr:twin-arginine translocation signal domain-containing protein [Chloroflexota bacterium]